MRAQLGGFVLLAALACRHAPPRAPEPRVHVVRAGETLGAIARAYEVELDALAELNGIADPDKVDVGRRLLIPGATRLVAAPPPREEPPSPKPRPPDPETPPPEVGSSKYIWPVDGVVVSAFGRREGADHDGIDIAAPLGTTIWAAREGRVIVAGEQPGYGTLVIIDHGDEVLTIYAHNRENLVREGAAVKQGDPIAKVGASGTATSPGVHFEVRVKTRPKNPLAFLP